MRIPPSVQSAVDWLHALARNPYFWAGMGALLCIGIVLFILVDAMIMPSYTRHDVSVRVPNAENRSYETAKTLIEERGLQVEREVGRFNPKVERDIVVDQNPPPRATVKPGRRVYLTVNAGEVPMVRIPDLNGISLREARNRVSSLGLVVDSVRADSIPSPYPNTITRQKPAPGDSLQTGSGVVLWYSTGLGQERVEVPNVVGQRVDVARRILFDQSLRAIVIDPGGSQESGAASTQASEPTAQFVLRQAQSPGSRVRAGTEIRLFLTDDSTEVPRSETNDSPI